MTASRRAALNKRAPAGSAGKKAKGTLEKEVQAVLASLESLGTRSVRAGMTRYATSQGPAARWIGNGALKEFQGPVVTRKMENLAKKKGAKKS